MSPRGNVEQTRDSVVHLFGVQRAIDHERLREDETLYDLVGVQKAFWDHRVVDTVTWARHDVDSIGLEIHG